MGNQVLVREVGSGMNVRWNDALAQRWRQQGDWLDTNLAELAKELATTDPDGVMVIEAGVEHTNRAIFDEARQLATAMIRRGLTPGSVVSYQIPNWYEGCVINIAAALAGLVVNPLVPIYRDNELRFMLDDVSSQIVFVPATFRKVEYAQMQERVNVGLGSPFDVIVLRGKVDGLTSYEDLLWEGDAGVPLPIVDPDSAFVVMHTSGTTGRPKCVVHSHNSFLVQGKVHINEFKSGPDDVNLVATPISHIAGIIVANLTSVFGGGTVILMDTWVPDEAVKLVEQYNATSCGGATPFIRGLLDAAKASGKHLPSLRRAGCGGAAVPPELIYQTHEWFPNILCHRVYGCTEVPTITAGTDSRELIDYGATTDGKIKHTEVKIVDAVTGEPVEQHLEGEILVRGAAMMLGYLRMEDNEAAFDADGFFKTGDLGRIVDGAYLVITGRKKDLIIRHGENLSPKEIEDALFECPDIENAAVVGMPDPVTGEAVCAFVVPKAGKTLKLADVASHLVGLGMAKQKIPQRLVLVDEMPTSPQGKILKNILRDRAKELGQQDL